MKKRDEAYADRLFGYVLWNEYLTGQSRQSIETLSDYMGIEFPFEITERCALVISGMERIAYRQYGVTAIAYDQAADRLWREQMRPALEEMGYRAEYTMEIYNEYKHLVYILSARPNTAVQPIEEAVAVIHDALQAHFLDSFLPEDSLHGNFTVYLDDLKGQMEIMGAFNRLRHMHGYTFFSPKVRIHEANALESQKESDNENVLLQAQRDFTSAVYNLKGERAMSILKDEIGGHLRRSLNRKLCQTTMNNLRLDLLEIHTLYELPTDALVSTDLMRSNTFDGILEVMVRLTEETLALLSEKQLCYSPVVRMALLYLRGHFQDNLQLADIADYAGVSPSYLSRLFNAEIGTSIPSYLLRLRLEEACKQLTRTQDNISVISARCGFSSSGYFCRLFRKVNGISPLEYRAKNV